MIMRICCQKDAGHGLRTLIWGCLAVGPIAIAVPARPGIADDRSAAEVPAAPQPRLPRENLLVFRGPDHTPRPVRSVADWLQRRAEILAGMQAVMGWMPGPEKRCPLEMKVEEEVDCGRYVRRL